MEKLEPTLDKRCGSESGYRRHRRSNEHKCQPCKDAHNIYRRATYNPEVNRKHTKKYREVHSEAIKERHKKYVKHVDPEVKAARKVERAKATAERAALQKSQKQAMWQERLAKQKETTRLRQLAKAEERARLAPLKAEKSAETGRRNFAAANARKSAEAAIRNKTKKEIAARRRLIKRLITLINRRIAKLSKVKRETNRTLLANQHGVTVGDYDRCRKNNNGVACAPCKAAAAKYARNKFHSDPKYKEAEKRWRLENPHKVYRSNKDRAIKNGGKHKYYTRQHIFDRDGYDCYICNTPVDLAANHIQGHPGWELYPHIEHVKPLSKGGDDILENVKIAHAICNIRKGAQFDEATATT